jgi:single-stranded DNA-binding protein
MSILNNINVSGRLVEVPIYTPAQDGNPAHNCVWGRIANNEAKRPDGTQPPANFIPFVAWGKLADALAKVAKKGKELTLEGRLMTRSQELENGTYKNYFEVKCRAIHFGPDAKNSASAPVTGQLSQADMIRLAEAVAALQAAPPTVTQPAQTEPQVTETDDPFPL